MPFGFTLAPMNHTIGVSATAIPSSIGRRRRRATMIANVIAAAASAPLIARIANSVRLLSTTSDGNPTIV